MLYRREMIVSCAYSKTVIYKTYSCFFGMLILFYDGDMDLPRELRPPNMSYFDIGAF